MRCDDEMRSIYLDSRSTLLSILLTRTRQPRRLLTLDSRGCELFMRASLNAVPRSIRELWARCCHTHIIIPHVKAPPSLSPFSSGQVYPGEQPS